MIWYSLSVSVCAGATVIESPVCTPIGSRFSIEQTMMQLSLRVAHHLHLEFFPADQRFLDQQFLGRRGFEAALADARRTLPGCRRCRRRVPPMVKDGRMMVGKPIAACTC